MANYGYNYLAPRSPKQLKREIRQSVNAQIAPYLGQINRAESQGSGMIANYSEQLAHQLLDAQRQTRQNYGQAEASQASINTALANRLSGAGAAVSNDLASQLAAAGQSTAPSSAVGAIGSGASNAGYASGSASLSALLAQGAAAQQYAGQLPNLARMQGVQQQGLFFGQQEKNRGDLLAKVPGLIDTATQQAQAQEFQKAVAVQSGLVDQQKLQLDTQYKQARLNQGQQSLNLRASALQTSNLFKQAGLDLRGKQFQLSVQREHRLAQGKAGKKGGFTPTQIQKLQGNAIEAVKVLKHGQQNPNYDPSSPDYHNGIPDKRQWKSKPGADPHSAFRYLINHGVPPTMADWAVGSVYGKWHAPGEKGKRGRGGAGAH